MCACMCAGRLFCFAPFEPIPHGYSRGSHPTLSAKNIGVPPAWRCGIMGMLHSFSDCALGAAMADIITSCPILKVPVNTGLTTEMIVFESLSSSIEVLFRCPACRKIHRWTQKDASTAKLVKCPIRWSLAVLQFLSF